MAAVAVPGILPCMPITDARPTAVMYRMTFNPVVMKVFAKFFYPLVTRRLGTDELLFLNDGYEEDPPMALPLVESDEPHRFPIQLYHRTATQAGDLSGKRVLEVSCGHGGGASYLTRTLRPASYTALDLNPVAVDSCRRRHKLPGLEFLQGNAQELPFADQSFDAVINVEASHCYPQFRRFLAEVARVLRPGGHLLYADVRPRLLISAWEAALADAPMRIVSETVINAEVLRALDERTPRLLDQVSNNLPKYLQGIGREATHVQGSRFYRDLQRGEFSWRMYSFVKD